MAKPTKLILFWSGLAMITLAVVYQSLSQAQVKSIKAAMNAWRVDQVDELPQKPVNEVVSKPYKPVGTPTSRPQASFGDRKAPAKELNATNEADLHIAQHLHQAHCQRKPKVRFAKQQVYQWKDASGKVHFSDQAPKSVAANEVQSRSMQSSAKFSLDLNSEKASLPAFARDRITRDVNTIYRILIKALAIKNVDPILLRLRLFDEKSAFNRYKKKVAPNMGKAGGFYIGRLREASVFTSDNEQRMYSVIRHEAVHAINHQAFGRTPTWLNEGLAEYFESLEFQYGSHARTLPNTYQLGILKRSSLPFLGEYLQVEHKDWYADESQSLRYAVAWSLVTFFLSSEETTGFFKKMLNHLSANYCQSMDSLAYINQHFPGGVNQLDSQWRKFLSKEIPLHYY